MLIACVSWPMGIIEFELGSYDCSTALAWQYGMVKPQNKFKL